MFGESVSCVSEATSRVGAPSATPSPSCRMTDASAAVSRALGCRPVPAGQLQQVRSPADLGRGLRRVGWPPGADGQDEPRRTGRCRGLDQKVGDDSRHPGMASSGVCCHRLLMSRLVSDPSPLFRLPPASLLPLSTSHPLLSPIYFLSTPASGIFV